MCRRPGGKLLLLLCLFLPLHVSAQQLSAGDPTRLRFAHDPQAAIFSPGNSGRASFHTTVTRQAANFAYGEERQTDGQVIHLYESNYEFSPAGADAESTRPAGYWLRLTASIFEAGRYGVMTDCRVTSALATELRNHDISWPMFAQVFAAKLGNDAAPPMFSLELPSNTEAASVLKAFDAALPRALVGYVCRRESDFEPARRGDFAVVNDAAIPPQYAGQATLSYLRAKLGQMPILLETDRPQIFRELFWLGSGAAGIQYGNALSTTGSKDHRAAWRNIRSLSSIPRRFGGKFRLAPELAQRGMFGAIIADGFMFAVFPLRNFNGDMQLPANAEDRPEFIATWYNLLTDENIVMPRVPAPRSGKLHLTTPSGDPWIYFHAFMPASSDANSTMTLILPEPPEPAEDI